MTYMNDYDFHQAEQRLAGNPTLYPVLNFLKKYRDMLNQNSDGWGHFPAGTKVAKGLIELVEGTVEPTSSAITKAKANVKKFCTKRGLPPII